MKAAERIACLGIETTGLSSSEDRITVIGIGLENRKTLEVGPLVDSEVTRRNLLAALKGVIRLFTHNCSTFDVPFVRKTLGVDLNQYLQHHDLKFDCWRWKLYGGLKAVEEQLGIPRRLRGLSGTDAVELCHKYKNRGYQGALKLLLEYNSEDVANLRRLKSKLELIDSQDK